MFRDLVSVAVLFIQTDVKPDKGELVARRWRCVWRRAAREQGGMGESGAQPGTGSRPVWCEWAAGILSLSPLLAQPLRTAGGSASLFCDQPWASDVYRMCLLVMLGKTFLVPGELALLSSFLSRWCLPFTQQGGGQRGVRVEKAQSATAQYTYSVCLCRLLGQVLNASIYIFLNNSYIKM